METFKCCICGGMCKGYGNNPWPVVEDVGSRCCEYCNDTKVIPARIKLMTERKDGTEQSK
jgi:hypothetical protein